MVVVSKSSRATYSGRFASRVAAIGIQHGEPPFESGRGLVAQVLVEGDAGRRGEVRQEILAQRNRQVAALRDGDRVRERLGKVGEGRGHLRLRLEVLLGRERPGPARIGEDKAPGNADARLVRAKILAAQKLHRMRRDDGQRELAGEPHCRGDERIVVGAARALHFEVVAPRKEVRPRARRLRRAARIALQERAADLAVARAGKRDQPVGALVQPIALQFRASAVLVGAVGARQPFGEPQDIRRAIARAAARGTADRARRRASARRRSRRSA